MAFPGSFRSASPEGPSRAGRRSLNSFRAKARRLAPAALAVVCCLLAPWFARAMVYLDISSPNVRKVPVAVPAPRLSGGIVDKAGGPHFIIAETLRNDLAMSGIFDVLDPKGYLEDSQKADLVPTKDSYADWYVVGTELLVKGQLFREKDELVADLYAYDVLRREYLFGKRYRAPEPSAALIGHMFANTILEKYTGKPGPFGSAILCVIQRGQAKEVVRIDFEGSPPQPVTSNGSLNLSPVWSRPGQSVYLTTYLGGNPDLARFELRDRKLRYLYRNPGMDIPGEESPDGKFLLFSSSTDGNSEIYKMELTTRAVTKLTDHRAIDVSPTWSPDGKKLAFVSDRMGSPHIFVLDAENPGEPKRITFAGKHNGDPAWSPDGDRIAFTGLDDKGVFQIFLVDPEGSGVTQLTHGRYDTLEPSWSPDARFLAVTSRKEGADAVFVLNIGTLEMRRVSPAGLKADQPFWSYGVVPP
jgi:TolB protein